MVSSFLAFQPIRSGSVSAQVVARLRAAIFSGQLAPGQPLRELHLARDLGVSQATVREALGRLERFGLVVRTPQVGTQVTRLTGQEVRERIELRRILEEKAMLAAAPRLDAPALDALHGKLDALTEAIERNDYFEQAQADLAFHRFIWEQSGNRTLYHTLDQLAVPLFAFVSILRGAHREHLADVVQSHAGLVQALVSGDPRAITEALRQHFEYAASIPSNLAGQLP